jgi:PEP-CTERM motif
MRLLSKVLCVAVVAATTLVAKADSIDGFTLTEFGHTITWLLPSSPTPDYSASPHFFILDNVPVYYDGMPAMADMEFASTLIGGGVSVDIAGVDFNGFPDPFLASGTQLFSGPTPSPTFLTGQYSLEGEHSQENGPATLVITPEPSTFMLLGSGILVFAGAARRKLSRV